MNRRSIGVALVAAGFSLATINPAEAVVVGFNSNPSGNSADFAAFIAAQGGVINSTVNFDAHPVGPLNPVFYVPSAGVTIVSTDPNAAVVFGAGPGQGNTGSGPTSTGEGLHPASNFLQDGSGASTVTITFSDPVFGAGIFIIDLFAPASSPGEATQITAFTGPSGTGTNLGTFTVAPFNYQRNFQVFLGIGSTTGDILSIRLTDRNAATGDVIGFDDLRFAPAQVDGRVPEPTTLALLGVGLLGLAALRRRRPA